MTFCSVFFVTFLLCFSSHNDQSNHSWKACTERACTERRWDEWGRSVGCSLLQVVVLGCGLNGYQKNTFKNRVWEEHLGWSKVSKDVCVCACSFLWIWTIYAYLWMVQFPWFKLVIDAPQPKHRRILQCRTCIKEHVQRTKTWNVFFRIIFKVFLFNGVPQGKCTICIVYEFFYI